MNKSQSPISAAVVFRASMLYAAGVFAIGFVLGALRTIVLAPKVGAVLAVSIETPIVLLSAWLVYDRLSKFMRLNLSLGFALLLGLRAFMYLQFFEIAVFVFVFKKPMGAYADEFKTVEGMIGLSAQILFAFVPLVHRRLAPRA